MKRFALHRVARRAACLLLCFLTLQACTKREQSRTEKDSTNVQSAPQHLTESLNVLEGFREETIERTVGQEFALQDLHPACVGWATPQPSVHLYVEEARALKLHATPQRKDAADLVMAIQSDQGGVLCSDDIDGLNPVLETHFDAGAYKVWIGAHKDPSDDAFTLHIEDAFHALPQGDAPQEIHAGTYGGLRIPEDTGPAQLTGSAGGTRKATEIGPGCDGVIAMRPDHVLTLRQDMELSVSARAADGDLVLLLEHDSGKVLCNDDAQGANPAIRETMDAGTWNVYVGTFAPSSYPEYVLRVSR